jgi:hypothetical protein
MIDDLEKIVTSVLPTDPSSRLIGRGKLDRCINEASQNALANAKDAFLLSLMRLLALPGNGHTRLIPNNAISVLPLRFVTIGTAACLLDARSDISAAIGGELISINGAPADNIERSAEKYLAGTPQRKRVIGPIMFAWPSALQLLGVPSDGEKITYRIRHATGRIRELSLDTADLVRASTFYPRNEHGKADASWVPQSYCKRCGAASPDRQFVHRAAFSRLEEYRGMKSTSFLLASRLYEDTLQSEAVLSRGYFDVGSNCSPGIGRRSGNTSSSGPERGVLAQDHLRLASERHPRPA